MKTRFITLGDLHLEKITKSYSLPESYVYEQLDKVTAYARKEGIGRIIQLGDIFDNSKPGQESIKGFIEYLNRNNDLQWIFLTGNHDYFTNQDDSTLLCSFLADSNILKNVEIYNKPRHRLIDGFDFFFAPFPHYEKFDYLKDKPCFCFGHFEVGGALNDNGMPVKSGVPKTKLKQEDFWILGHLHRQQELGRIYYPGTAYQLSFGEPLPKGFAVIEGTLEQGILNVSYDYVKLETPYILENFYVEKQEHFNNLHINDSKHLYKLFIQDPEIVIPAQFLNGAVKNVYKIVSGVKKEASATLSLSEDFNLANQQTFFEPLTGLEEYLQKLEFTQEEVVTVLDKVATLSQKFIQKR